MCGVAPLAANVDCNDSDAFVHPGQREVCDGVDDNCDGALFVGPEFCFSAETATCLVGQRTCMDTIPPGLSGPCVTLPMDSAPAELCGAYMSCEAMSGVHDKLGCVANMTMTHLLYCDVDFDAAGL